MALFLNTTGLSKWIPRLIDEAQREIVIVVPYIKTSTKLHEHLIYADKRGVETTIVYRENKLTSTEREKLFSISNLNLMHHPNVHAKCYMNEKHLLITSMNLYEYSEKNNREMGILLNRDYGYGKDTFTGDAEDIDDDVFESAVKEIRAIINSSHIEKESWETKEIGFEMEIIKTVHEKQQDFCKRLNKAFGHKKFEVTDYKGEPISKCSNYFDKIDLYISHRGMFELNMPDDVLERAYRKHTSVYDEYYFKGFKYYWNYPKDKVYLYRDLTSKIWTDNNDENLLQFRKGVDDLILYLRKILQ